MEAIITKDTNAEAWVIGAMLHGEAFVDIAIERGCRKLWFTDPVYQAAFSEIVVMRTTGIPIGMISVSHQLLAKGIEAADHIIGQCYDKCDTTAHLEYYLTEVLRSEHKKRELGSVIDEARIDLLTSPPDAILARLRSKLDDLEMGVELDAEGYAKSTQDRIDKAQDSGFIGVPSRWLVLQNKTSGYKKGKTTLIAARPSVGKTTVALNESRYQAEAGYNVGFVSLETEIEELYETMAADAEEIDLFRIYSGTATPEDCERLKKKILEIAKLPFFPVSKTMDIDQVCSWIYDTHRRVKLDICYIDYVQLINKTSSDKTNEREHISSISRKIARLAKNTGIALVPLAQLSRGAEPPPGVKSQDAAKYVPKLHHLKESGSLEEDAYMVILLYNEQIDRDVADLPVARIVFDVAKHKRGPKGRVVLTYEKQKQRIRQ